MLHISIKAETLFHVLGLPITNSLLASILILALFSIVAFLFYTQSHKKSSSFVFFIRFIVNKIYGLFESIFKEKTDKYFPLVASFFLIILLSNWIGLLPGVGSVLLVKNEIAREEVQMEPYQEAVQEESHSEAIPLLRAGTADLNTTIALALVSVVLIQIYGIKELGFGAYIKKFINFSNPIDFFSGILEIVSEFSKIISFAFRLFGNIFAGEVLLAVIAFLIPVLASFPFLMLEIFVGFIQAIVFSMLTAVFINMAIAKHH